MTRTSNVRPAQPIPETVGVRTASASAQPLPHNTKYNSVIGEKEMGPVKLAEPTSFREPPEIVHEAAVARRSKSSGEKANGRRKYLQHLLVLVYGTHLNTCLGSEGRGPSEIQHHIPELALVTDEQLRGMRDTWDPLVHVHGWRKEVVA